MTETELTNDTTRAGVRDPAGHGRVAVVTGAAQGIGRDYALTLAASGHRVVVADLNRDKAEETAELVRADGAEALAVTVDVSDQQSVRAMAAAVDDAFGGADVLVNNAAIYHSMKRSTLLDMDIDYWRSVFSVNLDGTLLCIQALAPQMIAKGWGRIVNQSSIAAYWSGSTFYSCSKLAVLGLTQSAAKELGPHGISVNALAPGVIATEATKVNMTEQQLDALVTMMAVPRLGQTSDLCGALDFLVSDKAEWITGETLVIDGGRTMRL